MTRAPLCEEDILARGDTLTHPAELLTVYTCAIRRVGMDLMPSNKADHNHDGYVTVTEFSAWHEKHTGKVMTVIEMDYKKFAARFDPSRLLRLF